MGGWVVASIKEVSSVGYHWRRVMEQRGGSPFSSLLMVTPPHTTVTAMEGEFQPCKPTLVLVRISTVGVNALLSTAPLSFLLSLSSSASFVTFVAAFTCAKPCCSTTNPATFDDPRLRFPSSADTSTLLCPKCHDIFPLRFRTSTRAVVSASR